jgi:hypothetical protein
VLLVKIQEVFTKILALIHAQLDTGTIIMFVQNVMHLVVNVMEVLPKIVLFVVQANIYKMGNV